MRFFLSVMNIANINTEQHTRPPFINMQYFSKPQNNSLEMSTTSSEFLTETLKSGKSSHRWRVLELILNTLNHFLIGAATLYCTWYCFIYGFKNLVTYHVLLTTVGVSILIETVLQINISKIYFQYQLLMAEGMLSLYSGNSWTLLNTRETKNTIHWVLQFFGSILAIAGTLIETVYLNRRKRNHIKGIHSLLGFISIILLSISILSGITSLFAPILKKYLKPLYSKLTHNVLAIATFAFGMASITAAYLYENFAKTHDFGNQRVWAAVITTITIFLTLIGPLKTLYIQTRALLRI